MESLNPLFAMNWVGVSLIAYSYGGFRAAGAALVVGAFAAGFYQSFKTRKKA